MENVLASAAKSNKSYVQGHEADIKDVSTRVLRILARAWKDKMLTDEPFILAAGELYPSEAVKLDKSKILGLLPDTEQLILIRQCLQEQKEFHL